MTSVLKSDRVGKPASKRPKKKTDSEGIQRLQKALDSLNAEHEAEIRPSTPTPAGLDEDGISPPQETTFQINAKRSGHASTMFENRGTPALDASPETSGLTNPGAQSSSRAPEAFNNDMIKARGFGRLSGLSARPHLIYSGMRLTSLKTEHRTIEAIAACKAATSILIEIVNRDSNNAYVTPYSGGGLQTYGLPNSSPNTYASPYINPVPNVKVTLSPTPCTNDAGKSSIEPGRQPLDRTTIITDISSKQRKPQELPVQPCKFVNGDHPAKRRKRNSSVQNLNACNGLHKAIQANGITCSRTKIAEGSKQNSDRGIDELKGSAENEKVYPTTLEGIDNFLTQAKGRFPGPDSDDSDNDTNQANKKCAEKLSHNGESTISPPSSPQSTNGQTKPHLQDASCPDDRDILAIVDRIISDIMPSESSYCVQPQGIPHFNFRGSLEAQRLAVELKRQVTLLNPQKNLIVSKDLGLVMSMFYNYLSSRAFSCSKTIIPPPRANLPFGMRTPLAQPGLLPMNYQPLPAHVYQHVPPPATFHQTVVPSQPPSFITCGNVIPPPTLPVKEEHKVRRYGFPPTPDTCPGQKKRQRN